MELRKQDSNSTILSVLLIGLGGTADIVSCQPMPVENDHGGGRLLAKELKYQGMSSSENTMKSMISEDTEVLLRIKDSEEMVSLVW